MPIECVVVGQGAPTATFFTRSCGRGQELVEVQEILKRIRHAPANNT